jgi:topoisomerase-4 subunit A
MVDVIDEVIDLIRKSKSKKDAREKLVKTFDFSEEQAEAILTLQLYRLSNTDLNALIKEKETLEKTIQDLKDILSNERSLENVIKKDLRAIIRKVKSPRRTTIEDEIERIEVQEEDLIESEAVRVGLTREGYIRRASLRSFKATETPDFKENDAFLFNSEVSSTDTLLIFTDHGHYIYLPVFKLTEGKWKDMGLHINHIVPLSNGEKIISVHAVSSFDENQGYLIFTTRDNVIKRTAIKDFDVQRYNRAIRSMKLSKGDIIEDITHTYNEDSEIMTFTKTGHALRYDVGEIPCTSTSAKGVKALNLKPAESLACSVVLEANKDVIVLTSRGTLRRFNPGDIEKKKRTLKGESVIKEVKTNPYLIVDAVLMDSVQYKKRAPIHILTDKGETTVSAFEVKSNQADTGKKFVKGKQTPFKLFIESGLLEEDEEIQPLNEFIPKPTTPLHQQSLFEE